MSFFSSLVFKKNYSDEGMTYLTLVVGTILKCQLFSFSSDELKVMHDQFADLYGWRISLRALY